MFRYLLLFHQIFQNDEEDIFGHRGSDGDFVRPLGQILNQYFDEQTFTK